MSTTTQCHNFPQIVEEKIDLNLRISWFVAYEILT